MDCVHFSLSLFEICDYTQITFFLDYVIILSIIVQLVQYKF